MENEGQGGSESVQVINGDASPSVPQKQKRTAGEISDADPREERKIRHKAYREKVKNAQLEIKKERDNFKAENEQLKHENELLKSNMELERLKAETQRLEFQAENQKLRFEIQLMQANAGKDEAEKKLLQRELESAKQSQAQHGQFHLLNDDQLLESLPDAQISNFGFSMQAAPELLLGEQ